MGVFFGVHVAESGGVVGEMHLAPLHRPLDINFAFASALGRSDITLSRQTRRFKHDGLTEHSNKPIHIPLHIALEL